MTTTDHLRQLLAKATPGPWGASDNCEHACCHSKTIRHVKNEDYDWIGEATNDKDAALIVALINAAPALLDCVIALQELVYADCRCYDCLSKQWEQAAEALAKLDEVKP